MNPRISLVVSSVSALVVLALGAAGLWEVSWFGFPDGRQTDYQRAAARPLVVLYGLHFLIGLYLVRLVLFNLSDRVRRRRLMMTLAILALLLAVTHGLVPRYFGDYLGLDRGSGG